MFILPRTIIKGGNPFGQQSLLSIGCLFKACNILSYYPYQRKSFLTIFALIIRLPSGLQDNNLVCSRGNKQVINNHVQNIIAYLRKRYISGIVIDLLV